MRLEGKVAIITGAGSGIGKATARLFAKEGAKILAADYNAKSGKETVEEIKQTGGTASFIEVNIGQVSDNKRMVDTAINLYQRLDILYNNAGLGGPTLETTTEENWQAAKSQSRDSDPFRFFCRPFRAPWLAGLIKAAVLSYSLLPPEGCGVSAKPGRRAMLR